MATWALEFSHVSARRGFSDVLSDVHFRINRAESVALLGPNGSGKSSLVKLITRELYPSSGTLSVFGKESWDVFELRSHLGIVSNDLQTFFSQEMSGLEAVLSGYFSSVGLWKNNRITPAMQQQALKTLKKLGLSHLKERSMDKISSGEARRLLIARALIHSPQALVFDEPTNSLDLKAQHEFRAILRGLVRSGVGIILATHQLSDIIPEIKRVLVLKKGRLVADGSKKEILQEDQLKELFEVPVRLVKNGGEYFVAS